MTQLADKVVKLMDESLQRTNQTGGTQAKQKKDDDEEDDDDDDEDEFSCRQALCGVLSALMEVGPDEFSQTVLAPVSQKMAALLSMPDHRPLGLLLGCNMLEHLKHRSEPVWQVLFPEVFKAIDALSTSTVPAVLASTYATWAINLAAPLPNFGMAAPDAFRKVAMVVRDYKPKKRDEKGKVALDNAVAALVSLAKAQAPQCPPEIQPWTLALANLPLKEDEDEAKKVHETIVDLLMAQDEGLLGGPQRANLPQLLRILAEIYKVEDICSETSDTKIQQVFTMLPQDVLASCAGNFSEKQQKKIQKIRTIAPAA